MAKSRVPRKKKKRIIKNLSLTSAPYSGNDLFKMYKTVFTN